MFWDLLTFETIVAHCTAALYSCPHSLLGTEAADRVNEQIHYSRVTDDAGAKDFASTFIASRCHLSTMADRQNKPLAYLLC